MSQLNFDYQNQLIIESTHLRVALPTGQLRAKEKVHILHFCLDYDSRFHQLSINFNLNTCKDGDDIAASKKHLKKANNESAVVAKKASEETNNQAEYNADADVSMETEKEKKKKEKKAKKAAEAAAEEQVAAPF